MKRLLSWTLAVSIACLLPISQTGALCAAAAGKTTGDTVSQTAATAQNLADDDKSYGDLLKLYESAGYVDYAGKPVQLSLRSAKTSGGKPDFSAKYAGKDALTWADDVDTVEWTVSVSEAALYNVEIDYYAVSDKSTDIQRGLKVDGEVPAVEWNNLRFSRLFQDDGAARVDSNGDQTAPRMKQVFRWQTEQLSDYNGYYSEPMKLYLSAGVHTLTFVLRDSQSIAIGGVRLVAPRVVPDYAKVKASYAAKGYREASSTWKVEGENTLYRSSASLLQQSSSDLSCSPSNPGKTTMNAIGGSVWKASRQTITWEIDVPENGLYQLALHRYSYYNYGDPAFRRIEIDGEVPFKELEAYCFLPNTSWQTESLQDNQGTPYQFYLTRGKHQLSMSAVAGDMTSIIEQLSRDMKVLSALYLNITLVTTSDPDPNYDYELDKRVPGLLDTMSSLYQNLENCAEQLRKVCRNDKALTYSEMKNTLEDLRTMMGNVFGIPSNIDQFTTMLTQYGNWISTLKTGTMSIDTLQILPISKTPADVSVSVWKRMWAGLVSFFSTFTKDYNSVISYTKPDPNMETIDVWYGGTQIWATEVQNLIETSFVPQNKIQVRFKLTPADQMSTGINAMLLAILSGTAPDVVLSAPSIEDYAMRGQSYDLSKFNDFHKVASRFPSVCFVPLTYHGGVYGLPQTIDTTVMFYRTDIFRKLGIGVPQTWNDMIDKVIPRLAENSMTLASSPGYDMLLFQMGGGYYNAGMTKSTVDSQVSWKAFKLNCDFYTMYGVPLAVNFFNRFRSGETPVGFGNIGTYLQLIYAAPELAGRWKIAPVPGIQQADGSINRTIGSLLSSSAMIMAETKKADSAWSFLKWYTSTKPQVELSEQMEAKLDMSARLFSANTEAFRLLNWNKDDLDVLMKSMEQSKAYNPVLGGYYTGRYLNYAFNYVVVSKNMSEREALEYAAKNINNELERRRSGLS